MEISSLREHPKNYREHPDDQLEHLQESLKEHGFYRNIVVAKEGTILAGHGMVKAAAKSGLTSVPVIRLDVAPDDPRALKVLIGDNEIEHLAEQNDRLLTELLKQIKDTDQTGLLGTGYDEMMLANLVMVTRPASEIADMDEAAQWVGMPEYDEVGKRIQLLISFETESDRDVVSEKLGLGIGLRKATMLWTSWYPPREKADRKSLKFEG